MANKFIISIGGNIRNPEGLHPIQTFKKAINELKTNNINLISKSDLFLSEPIPKSFQPKYYNLVLICKSSHLPHELLRVLLRVESKLGRIRLGKNMKRCLDLDLIDFNNRIKKSLKLVIPHPRTHLRKFVLYPLRMICPSWCHPNFKKNLYYYLKKNHKQKLFRIKNVDF